MQRYATVSEARQRFLQLVDEVLDGDQVVITRRGLPAAALINLEQLETLRALAGLWQDPEALRAMREAFEDSRENQVLKTRAVPRVRNLLRRARRPRRARA